MRGLLEIHPAAAAVRRRLFIDCWAPAWIARQGTPAPRWLRQARELVQSHWDVVAFDLAFGSVKAFGVYPALFALGLAWAIPVAEYAPLNTQLWTAGYLLVRRRVASVLGRYRYGYSLDRLDAAREALGAPRAPRDRAFHPRTLDGRAICVEVIRGRLAHFAGRWRASRSAAISVWELRGLVRDPELRLRAEALRHNPLLYEQVLLEHLLATPDGRRALLERLGDTPSGSDPAAGPDGFRQQTSALLIDQADVLARAPRAASSASRALRWLHGAYRRKIRREADDMEDLGHRLLAAGLDGREGDVNELRSAHALVRARIAGWLDCADALVARVSALRTDAQLRTALARELAIAGRLGLRPSRAAALAGWLARWDAGRSPAGIACGEGAR